MGARVSVEGSPANLERMTCPLSASGHSGITIEVSYQGLDAAHREHPGTIISDVQSPDIDGYHVAWTLESGPDLRSHLGERDDGRSWGAGCWRGSTTSSRSPSIPSRPCGRRRFFRRSTLQANPPVFAEPRVAIPSGCQGGTPSL
jgi:hypothetical protein